MFKNIKCLFRKQFISVATGMMEKPVNIIEKVCITSVYHFFLQNIFFGASFTLLQSLDLVGSISIATLKNLIH